MGHGKLIEYTETKIRIKCLTVAKDPKDQDEICKSCSFHKNPDKKLTLHCKMY